MEGNFLGKWLVLKQEKKTSLKSDCEKIFCIKRGSVKKVPQDDGGRNTPGTSSRKKAVVLRVL